MERVRLLLSNVYPVGICKWCLNLGGARSSSLCSTVATHDWGKEKITMRVQLELNVMLFSFQQSWVVCYMCKFNEIFSPSSQLLFTIKSLCILISDSLSSGNSKHNDSITRIFWLGTFFYSYLCELYQCKVGIKSYAAHTYRPTCCMFEEEQMLSICRC